jgi:hypothetical protein
LNKSIETHFISFFRYLGVQKALIQTHTPLPYVRLPSRQR